MGSHRGRTRQLIGSAVAIVVVGCLALFRMGGSIEGGLEAAQGAMRGLGWPVDELYLVRCSHQAGLVPAASLEATYGHPELGEPWAIGLAYSPFGGWSVAQAAAPEGR
jgi:hypothetical protein